jgi:hypothetical protein
MVDTGQSFFPPALSSPIKTEENVSMRRDVASYIQLTDIGGGNGKTLSQGF